MQATDREISLLKARMNDVYAVTRQNMARLLFTNNAANPLFPDSASRTPSTTAPISRPTAASTAQRGGQLGVQGPVHQPEHAGTFSTVARSASPARSMATLLANITDQAGGEAPTFGVMSPGDFADAQQRLHRD